LKVDLTVTVKGIAQAEAEKLVEKAHQVCPYSNATRGNIEVTLKAIAA
ncbi:MAG: osmotically inducible protein, partial [Nevskia sp.]|nr:osmotically inducible protein [Nevskia sp.]